VAADVLILGCGPAGLLAAHAVEQLGGRPHILSIKVKSEFQGAQYLHQPISGLTGAPHGVIRTHQSGTREGYAQKVYGDPSAPCSWNDQLPERDAWDLRLVYDELWDRYRGRVEGGEIDWEDLDEFQNNWKLVLSTLPLIKSCVQERFGVHHFEWEPMWTIGFAPPEVADNTVLYSGDLDCDWYRSSRVFGHASTEFSNHRPITGGAYLTPEEIRPPQVYQVHKGIKVQGTDCDCWPGIKRIGRFGTWRKGYLSHHAYHDAARYFQEVYG
jgi:hypothetical protein